MKTIYKNLIVIIFAQIACIILTPSMNGVITMIALVCIFLSAIAVRIYEATENEKEP